MNLGPSPSDQSDGVQNDEEDDENDDGEHDRQDDLLLSRRSAEGLGLVQVAPPRLHVVLRLTNVHGDVVDLRFGYVIYYSSLKSG